MQKFYTKNYRILLGGIKEALRKWRQTYAYGLEASVCKMSAFPVEPCAAPIPTNLTTFKSWQASSKIYTKF